MYEGSGADPELGQELRGLQDAWQGACVYQLFGRGVYGEWGTSNEPCMITALFCNSSEFYIVYFYLLLGFLLFHPNHSQPLSTSVLFLHLELKKAAQIKDYIFYVDFVENKLLIVAFYSFQISVVDCSCYSYICSQKYCSRNLYRPWKWLLYWTTPGIRPP